MPHDVPRKQSLSLRTSTYLLRRLDRIAACELRGRSDQALVLLLDAIDREERHLKLEPLTEGDRDA